MMKLVRDGSRLLAVAVLLAAAAAAQTCYTSADMDASTVAAIQSAAQQYLGMAQHGDYAGLRSSAIPAVASSFDGIQNAVGAHQKDLQGQAKPNPVFLLDASSANGTIQRAEFYCGIFNSPDRVGFIIPGLPAGKYAFASYAVNGGGAPVNVNFILQDNSGRWQLAGLTFEPTTVAGHDSSWYLQQARSLHQSGSNMTAYLYYWMAWKLAAPAEIEYTAARDNIASEMEKAKPTNWPTGETPLTLTANGKTYRVTSIYPEAVGNDLDIIVKYQAASDLNNTAAAFGDNTAVMKAMLTQFPELRQSFAGINALAVAPNGSNYSTLLAMKDVK